MRRSRNLFFFIELVLGAAAVILLVILFHPADEDRKVAAILSNSDAASWDPFILGMKQAAREEQLDLVIVQTGLITRADDEAELISQELADGADALIIQPAPGTDTGRMLEKTVGAVPAVLVPDGVYDAADFGQTSAAATSASMRAEDASAASSEGQSGAPGAFAVIGPDSYEMGQALAGMLLEDYPGGLEGKSIGIVNHSLNTREASLREAGFLDGISGSGCEVIWKLHGIEKSDQPEQEISNQSKADFVIALDTKSLETAGTDAETRRIRGAVVYGIASSEKALYDLDHDYARGLIFPNGYYMGYQCVREISKKLDSRFYTIKNEATPWMAVRRDDLFSEENEDLLFVQK